MTNYSIYVKIKHITIIYEQFIKDVGKEQTIMSELYCSNCKKLLSTDEKASGKCENCGAEFSST